MGILLYPGKRISAGAAAKHSVRVLTILARASFWALAYHYFGTTALVLVAASWLFALGVKDLTFARIRLTTLEDPAKRKRAAVKSASVELGLLVLRVVVFGAVAGVLALFNGYVASVVAGLAIATIFWMRETVVAVGRAYRVGGLRRYVSLISALSGLGALFYFAQAGLGPGESAIRGLLLREAVTFLGFAAVAFAGWRGLRIGDSDEFDEDDGGPAIVPGGDNVTMRSAWKVVIADNVVYSRWRLMQFATRSVASGVLGPFGGIATRLFFAYRQPGPYVHRDTRLPVLKIVAAGAATLAVLAAVAFVAEQWGLLHAVGIAIAALMFRVTALGSNLLLWRRLSPLVGSDEKIRIPGRALFKSRASARADENNR